MKRLLLPILLLAALPAAAQDRPAASAPSSGGAGAGANAGTSGPSNGGGGGSSSGGGGGAVSNGGGGNSGSGSGYSGGGGGGVGSTGGRVEVGGRHVATGGSGVAVTRGDRGGDRGGSNGNGGGNAGASGRRDRGDGSTGGTAVATPRSGADGRATGRRDAGADGHVRTPDGDDPVPPHSRPRDNQPVVGKAVPRGTVPTTPINGGGVGIAGGFYPWWFGGAYGGYYGGYYDPWFGGYPGGGGGYYDPAPAYQSYSDEGSLRLKIKPREAEVYVDGYFVGVVDDFDGVFQRLHIETGPHRIEVRAAGYEPLTLDVRVSPDHTTTYQGELKRIQ